MDKLILVNTKNMETRNSMFGHSCSSSFIMDDNNDSYSYTNDEWKNAFCHTAHMQRSDILGEILVTRDNISTILNGSSKIQDIFDSSLTNYIHFNTIRKKWELLFFNNPNQNILNDIYNKKMNLFYLNPTYIKNLDSLFSEMYFVKKENIQTNFYSNKDPVTGFIDIKSLLDIVNGNNINILVLPSNIGIDELAFINNSIHNNFNNDLLIHIALSETKTLLLNDSKDIKLTTRCV